MTREPEARANVIVIGGGVAALRVAIAAAEEGASVVVLSKGRVGGSGCSVHLERGIEYCALNCGRYTFEEQNQLAEEYLQTGIGLNRRDIVETFVAGLPAEHERLERYSLPTMAVDRARSRLLWTGQGLGVGIIGQRGFARALLQALRLTALELRVSFRERVQVLSIDRENGSLRGVLALDLQRGGLLRFAGTAVVVATGGAGGVFPLTTNPSDIVGDGFALAHRCGARLINMEFYSYYPLSIGRVRRIYLIHPLLTAGEFIDAGGEVWKEPSAKPGHALEQLRGVRDTCRWIELHASRSNGSPAGGCWWDGRRLTQETYEDKIPFTYSLLRESGIDLKHDRLEVAPHAHQSIGGVEVDVAGCTNVEGLFAAGEAAAGLHGALRMNGSGVTAGLVLGAIAGRSAASYAHERGPCDLPVDGTLPSGKMPAEEGRLRAVRKQIHAVMGPILVVRREEDLRRAQANLHNVMDEVEAMQFDPRNPALAAMREEVRTCAEVATTMVEHSLLRCESLGLFQRA